MFEIQRVAIFDKLNCERRITWKGSNRDNVLFARKNFVCIRIKRWAFLSF